MALEAEAVLVGDEAEHAVHPLVGEFGHGPALEADEMAVLVVGRARLEAAGAVAEIVGPGDPGLDQQVEGAVERRRPDPVAPALEEPLQSLDRQVLVGGEEGRGHDVPLTRHRKTTRTEPGAELFQKRARVVLREAHRGR